MSFILDALKKIEDERRRSSPGGGALSAKRGSLRRGHQLALMIGVAAISALVTAGALLLLADRPAGPSSVEAEAAAPKAAPRREKPLRPIASADRPTSAQPKPAATPASGAEPSKEARATAAEPTSEPQSAEQPEAPPADEPETPPTDELETPLAEEEALLPSSPAIRLVGREAALEGVRLEDPKPADPEPLPEHFPKLVLQGTSVIDGEPVAVISDQRVFEGDRIEGAQVVRIEERSVELVFEGRRFEISF